MKRLPLFFATVGILLRIIPIWAMPTWYDESFTFLVSRLPLDRLLAATAGDVHPPLWYLICWPLAHLPGLPPWAVVRIPALLASIAAIWVWWKIIQVMVTSDRVRLTAFGLVCLLPQQIYYAQEGRMYSLLTLLVLCSWMCILHKKWYWFAVMSSAMLWLHNYGLVYIAALWLAAMIYDRRYWKPLTIALACAGISFLPWVVVLFRQMGSITGNYWILRFSPPSILGDLEHTYFGNGLLDADMVNFAVFYGLLTWVLIWSLRHRSLNLPVIILAFLPVAIAAAISLIWQPVMLYRALIPSGVFIALILAEPTEYLTRKPQLLMAIFYIPVLAVNLAGIAIRSNWADWVRLEGISVSLVDSQWQDGDLFYYADDGAFITGSTNWKNIDNTMRVEQCGPVLGGLSPQTKAALGMVSGPLPDHLEGRIWVLTAETPLNPPCQQDYLMQKGLLNSDPLYCSQDSEIVKSCLYLVNP